MSEYEDGIIARHSTPGLRKNELNRAAKKEHLAGLKCPPDEAEKILGRLYPAEPKAGLP